ncbi:MAG: neutral zinc metallopeptidase [Steroidobacteraceae bacterium]
MRWRGRRQSGNIEDRRGTRVSGGMIGGGIGTVVLALVAMYFGVDPSAVLQMAGGGGGTVTEVPYTESAADAEKRQFVATVLAETETAWTEQFAGMGGEYRLPTLVLFAESVRTGCGDAQSGMGPFYCPPDEGIYIDTSFFDDMERQLQAGGDFAHAYVIAHEVGHHVQNLLGISGRVQEMRQRVGQAEGNQLSVRVELQADCFAGLWGNRADQAGILEPGDVEEALGAAAAIGDDRLQRNAGGSVHPDSFTHGTSEQRNRWLRRGLDTGSFEACDTFKAADL